MHRMVSFERYCRSWPGGIWYSGKVFFKKCMLLGRSPEGLLFNSILISLGDRGRGWAKGLTSPQRGLRGHSWVLVGAATPLPSGMLKKNCKMSREKTDDFRFRFQTLNSISAEKNSTIIFPLPIDFIKHFLKESPKEEKMDWSAQDIRLIFKRWKKTILWIISENNTAWARACWPARSPISDRPFGCVCARARLLFVLWMIEEEDFIISTNPLKMAWWRTGKTRNNIHRASFLKPRP